MRQLRSLKAPLSELQTLAEYGIVSQPQVAACERLLTLRRTAYGFEHPYAVLRDKQGRRRRDDEREARELAYRRATEALGDKLGLVLRVAVDGESRRQQLSLEEVRCLRRALDRLVDLFGAAPASSACGTDALSSS